MSKNKTTSYLIYSLGEIFLVVIGILLALAINNWNTDRIEEKYLNEAYKDIYIDMRTDLELLYGGIEPRLSYAEMRTQNMLQNIHAHKSDSINTYFRQMRTYFSFTVTKGGYESLKEKGIGIIKNRELRIALFQFYEMAIPRAINFIHGDDEAINAELDALEKRITMLDSYQNEEGQLWIGSSLKSEEVLNSQDLLRMVRINDQSLRSKRYRVDGLKVRYLEITRLIEAELERRAIDYNPFDPEEVAIDY